MTETKKKLAAPQLKPPKILYAAEDFAFLSPEPLDVCARRLIASNRRSFIATLLGMPQIGANVMTAGMNDQYFALTSAGQRLTRGWTVGLIADVEGEATWVTGEIGVRPATWWTRILIAMSAIFLLLPFALGLTPVMQQFAVLALPVLWLGGYVADVMGSKAQMRAYVRETFGLGGDGPLPLEDAPGTTMEGNDERDEETADAHAGESAEDAGGGVPHRGVVGQRAPVDDVEHFR
jgi:hypothetical protein